MDEIQVFHDILTINLISSNSDSKSARDAYMPQAPVFPMSALRVESDGSTKCEARWGKCTCKK